MRVCKEKKAGSVNFSLHLQMPTRTQLLPVGRGLYFEASLFARRYTRAAALPLAAAHGVIPSYDRKRIGVTRGHSREAETQANADALQRKANWGRIMKATRNMTNQGGPNPGNPKPDIPPPDENPNPERKDPEPSEQPGNPNPDSRPNEIRATDANYRYRGGRQGVGEVPNAGEVRQDADNIRERADRGAGDDAEPFHGDGCNPNKHLNRKTRNSE